jgi:hypothetical protein
MLLSPKSYLKGPMLLAAKLLFIVMFTSFPATLSTFIVGKVIGVGELVGWVVGEAFGDGVDPN